MRNVSRLTSAGQFHSFQIVTHHIRARRSTVSALYFLQTMTDNSTNLAMAALNPQHLRKA